MEKYKNLLTKELNNFKIRIPPSDGTVHGKLKRAEFIKNNSDEITNIINKVYNDFLNENPDVNVSELKNISNEYYLEFIKSF
ncbi:hypothetical protein C7H62_0520 [Mesoflavibacter sp. HG96]|uniref:hypothetical protein n=1 Tax=Mesoflavibacter TaxID=444051 RepID=UPI000D0EDDEE|nr:MULTISPECIES: hypothetical protein [Mesoflavibacter]QIJ88329.1 hypothetical protein C7H62_0520 [Mesoflavibacter sp. HG96]QIJ91057.1 hypothetical protein C7H56_0520 [Mesoflavibacter sp. HG37]